MKKRATTAAALMLFSMVAMADKYTNGYVRKDGTYVQGHYSTNANGSRLDNYSTQGNINPYNGKVGTVSPYGGLGNSYGAPQSGYRGRTTLDQPDPYNMRNSRGF